MCISYATKQFASKNVIMFALLATYLIKKYIIFKKKYFFFIFCLVRIAILLLYICSRLFIIFWISSSNKTL